MVHCCGTCWSYIQISISWTCSKIRAAPIHNCKLLGLHGDLSENPGCMKRFVVALQECNPIQCQPKCSLLLETILLSICRDGSVFPAGGTLGSCPEFLAPDTHSFLGASARGYQRVCKRFQRCSRTFVPQQHILLKC